MILRLNSELLFLFIFDIYLSKFFAIKFFAVF